MEKHSYEIGDYFLHFQEEFSHGMHSYDDVIQFHAISLHLIGVFPKLPTNIWFHSLMKLIRFSSFIPAW